MNGADVLRAVRLRWPDATRILATGNADLIAAARAVNEGQVSWLITKPWEPDQFRRIVGEALEAHRVLLENRRLRELADQQASRLEQWNRRLEELVAERTAELEKANASLQRGLLDTVRILLNFLERRVPERAARCREIARLAGRLAERAGVPPETARRVQVAALVHDIGLMGLPDPILRQQPEALPPASRLQYEQHPVVGQSMLSSVEQLVEIASWIRHHHERWDGRGYPDRLSGPAIPLPSRLIALADGYLEAVGREGGTAPRWRKAQRAAGAYDPDHTAPPTLCVPIQQLQPGMRLAEPVRTTTGAQLVKTGEVLAEELIGRLQSLAAGGVLASDSVPMVAQLVAGR
jgi:response regulator RpfG family c-di-GMP phosphodiesterase